MLKLVEFKPPDIIDVEWQYTKDLENNILYLEKYIGDGVGLSIPKTIEGEAKLYNPLTEECQTKSDYEIDVRLAKNFDAGNAIVVNIPVRYVVEYCDYEDEKIVLDADLDFKKTNSLNTVILRSCDVEQKCEAIAEQDNTSNYFEKDTAEFFKKVKECLLESAYLKEIYLDFGKYYSKDSCELFAENLCDVDTSKITTNAPEFSKFSEEVKAEKLEESKRKTNKSFFVKKYAICLAIFILCPILYFKENRLIQGWLQLALLIWLIVIDWRQSDELEATGFPENEITRFYKSLAISFPVFAYGFLTLVAPANILANFILGVVIFIFIKEVPSLS